MKKPKLEPQNMWAVVSRGGRVWATHRDKWIAEEDADTRNATQLYRVTHLAPFSVVHVTVTQREVKP